MHSGHRYLFSHLRQLAQQEGLCSLIVTFRQHPRAVLQTGYLPCLLTSAEERLTLLQAEADRVLMLDFAEICHLTAREFMQLLRDQYDVSTILMGYDHRFGADQLTQPADYQSAAASLSLRILTLDEYSIPLNHHPLTLNPKTSSTSIRHALESGDIALANALLGRPYSLTGHVVHGNAIGRTIGFPTANILPDEPAQLVPHAGVYHVQVISPYALSERDGIANIGTNPTVGNTEQTLELHIPDFDGDLYGQQLTLRFLRFLRPEQCFPSLDALRQQIAEDLQLLSTFRMNR